MLYDSSLPEVHGKNSESMKERTSSHRIISSTSRWIWMIVALLTVVAIAVGVGVGVWHRKEHSLHKKSTISRCGVRADFDVSWLIFTARQHCKIILSHPLYKEFLTIRLWPLCLSPMAIDTYSSKTILALSNV